MKLKALLLMSLFVLLGCFAACSPTDSLYPTSNVSYLTEDGLLECARGIVGTEFSEARPPKFEYQHAGLTQEIPLDWVEKVDGNPLTFDDIRRGQEVLLCTDDVSQGSATTGRGATFTIILDP